MAFIQPDLPGPFAPGSSRQDGPEHPGRERSAHDGLVDSIDGIVWEADPSFRFTFVSQQAQRLLGYPVQRWYQEPDFWLKHLHPEDREWAPSHCREAAEACLPHEFEYRMLASDGRVVWLRDIVTVVEEAGRPHRLRGIMVDITEQRRAQEGLQHTVSVLEATLESTADGLLVVDRAGEATAYNRRFKEIWGLSDAQAGLGDAAMLDTVRDRLKDPEAFFARVRELYAMPEAESFDVVELRDGRVLERYSLPQRQRGTITGRVWSFRDVSARVRAEREQERLLREAHEAIQVRDDFLSIASHELKTPLTPLRLHLQLLRHALESHQPVTPGRVDKALAQVRKLSVLINDLLDASFVGAGRMELQRTPVSLPEVVGEVFSDFRDTSDRHVLAYTAPDEDVLVQGDRGRLAQVLTNLLENALKYSPLGGEVRVTLTHSGGDAVVTVQDAGIGIPKEEQAHLFERFFRARNAPVSGFGGLGLGLYICRDIVERHGGHIWVESALGHGSAFHVSLPVLATRALHDAHV
ncbi:sensor histidine kinase [Pyxidicoccus xibeiensis]|uniref:sensor histidine kinase n=1 Tax=Pyxidicoccus xibeiensis TaxID=2906759 RepID=UPI0020A701D8|nr:PAS domain-containing sensor histidine kinase [Pyxidicoccus xibeiensis]MCP3136143.1 ATP-binding protein [Pyxidicoccus xibeiensis]